MISILSDTATIIGVIVGAIGSILVALAAFGNKVKGTSVKDILKEDNKEARETIKDAIHEFASVAKSQSELIREVLESQRKQESKDKN